MFLLLYIPVFLLRAGYLYDHVYISIWLLECVCISLYAIYLQGCQLSRIIRETPDFEPFLPVSRLEAEISRKIAEVCSFLYNRLSDNEISKLRCFSHFIVNIERFLTNSGMPL